MIDVNIIAIAKLLNPTLEGAIILILAWYVWKLDKTVTKTVSRLDTMLHIVTKGKQNGYDENC